MKLSEVKASYTKQKKEDGKKDPWANYIARPLSFYPAWLCIKLGITANQVTILGLLMGLIGCAYLGFGEFIVGAILINLYGLADYIDGAIARATHTESNRGNILDGASYLLIASLLPIALGIGLYFNTETILTLPLILYLILGVIGAHSRIQRYALTYQAQLPSEPSTGKRGILDLPIKVGMILLTLREPLLLICAITKSLDLFLILFALLGTLELSVILIKLFRTKG